MSDAGSSGHGEHEKAADPGQDPRGSSSDRAKQAGNGEKLDVAFRVTTPQLVSVAIMSVVALAGGLVFSAWKFNLSIGAQDVDGAVMAPGMIMTRDMPADAMRDMAAVDPDDLTYRAPVDARGDQPMEPVMDGDVKVYELEAAAIEWNILEYERVSGCQKLARHPTTKGHGSSPPPDTQRATFVPVAISTGGVAGVLYFRTRLLTPMTKWCAVT